MEESNTQTPILIVSDPDITQYLASLSALHHFKIFNQIMDGIRQNVGIYQNDTYDYYRNLDSILAAIESENQLQYGNGSLLTSSAPMPKQVKTKWNPKPPNRKKW